MFAFDPEVKIGTDTFETVRDDGSKLDLLDRAAFGKRLSQLMERDSQPLVVALDGAWGSGKSHFLKLWVGTHNQDAEHKARVVYFDAFARDYLDDPLISLVAAIARAQDDGEGHASAKTVHNLKSVAVKLAKPAIRIGLAAVTAGVSEGVVAAWDEVFDKSVEAMSDEAKAALDKLWQREEGRIAAVEGFHKALAELAAEQPLILVIDELDRCRPDYALSLLEVVKHFFAVKGVRFVLGVNLEALEHSVRQRYGAGVDAGLYLQKFVHLTVTLPNTPFEDDVDEVAPQIRYLRYVAKQLRAPVSIIEATTKLLSHLLPVAVLSYRDCQRIATRLALLSTEAGVLSGPPAGFLASAIILEILSPENARKRVKNSLTYNHVKDALQVRRLHPDIAEGLEKILEIWEYSLDVNPEPSKPSSITFESIFRKHYWNNHTNPLAFLRFHLDTFAPPPER